MGERTRNTADNVALNDEAIDAVVSVEALRWGEQTHLATLAELQPGG